MYHAVAHFIVQFGKRMAGFSQATANIDSLVSCQLCFLLGRSEKTIRNELAEENEIEKGDEEDEKSKSNNVTSELL